MSFATSTRLKKVAVSKSDESPSGVTLTVTSQPDSSKQNGFVEVFAKGAGKTKRLRIPVFVLGAKSIPAILPNGDPTAVAITTPPPANAPATLAPATQAPATPLPPTVPPTVATVAPTVPTTPPTTPPPPAPTTIPVVAMGINSFNGQIGQGEELPMAEVSVPGTNLYVGETKLTTDPLPVGMSARFVVSGPSISTRVLQIKTTTDTPRGDFPVVVRFSGPNGQGSASVTIPVRKFGPLTILATMPQLVAAGGRIPIHFDISAASGFDIRQLDFRASRVPLGLSNNGATTFDVFLGLPKDSAGNLDVQLTANDPYLKTVFSKTVSLTVVDNATLTYDLAVKMTAVTSTVTGGAAIAITVEDIAGMIVTWGPVQGLPAAMAASVVPASSGYQLSISATALPLGLYPLTVVATFPSGKTTTVSVSVNVVPFVKF
jgi:hypothetical protein